MFTSPVSVVLAWIAFGVIAGSVSMILPYRRGLVGIATNIGLGVFGALLGGVLGRVLRLYPHITHSSFSFLMASAGAIAVLWAYHAWWYRHHRLQRHPHEREARRETR
jgi:uncharacterized membrane protein YeaQ/YmgE (transglycosylase-associated protein family)